MKRLAIIDSGIGGLSYFTKVKKLLKDDYTYIYIADTANFPYGKKTEEQLQTIFTTLANKLKTMQLDVLLIACNTASLYGLETFEQILQIPVIATYPAINLAKSGPVAILATNASAKSVHLQELIAKSPFASSTRVWPASVLADLTEEHYFDYTAEQKKAILKPFTDEIIAWGASNLLLGCTHFVFLEAEIKELLQGSKIEIINNTSYIASEVERVLLSTTSSIKTQELASGFYSTNVSRGHAYKQWANDVGLEFKGEITC